MELKTLDQPLPLQRKTKTERPTEEIDLSNIKTDGHLQSKWEYVLGIN